MESPRMDRLLSPGVGEKRTAHHITLRSEVGVKRVKCDDEVKPVCDPIEEIAPEKIPPPEKGDVFKDKTKSIELCINNHTCIGTHTQLNLINEELEKEDNGEKVFEENDDGDAIKYGGVGDFEEEDSKREVKDDLNLDEDNRKGIIENVCVDHKEEVNREGNIENKDHDEKIIEDIAGDGGQEKEENGETITEEVFGDGGQEKQHNEEELRKKFLEVMRKKTTKKELRKFFFVDRGQEKVDNEEEIMEEVFGDGDQEKENNVEEIIENFDLHEESIKARIIEEAVKDVIKDGNHMTLHNTEYKITNEHHETENKGKGSVEDVDLEEDNNEEVIIQDFLGDGNYKEENNEEENKEDIVGPGGTEEENEKNVDNLKKEEEAKHTCQLTDYTKIEISQMITGTSVHSTYTLRKLMGKADRYIKGLSAGSFHDCPTFFRDKSTVFFDDTIKYHGGLMEVYKKDFHGDERSPINNRINGLFFNVNHTSHSRCNSIFGSRRLKIHPKFIIELCPNLYFTDFYCSSMRKRGRLIRSCGGKDRPHYVTLVMTKPGSDADNFCSKHIVPLDTENNPFLQIRQENVDDVSVKSWTVEGGSFWIEVLVTENIDIIAAEGLGATWEDVNCRGSRTGGLQGLPKTDDCDICNI